MLDNLYDNIGGKVKGLAKWTFILGAIGFIITGFVLLFTDEDLILFGFITLICGPVVAWVGSWVLYAIGELVEKTYNNENNTRNILKQIKEQPITNLSRVSPTTHSNASKNKSIITHKWRCDGCGNMREQTPCEFCGKE